MKRRPKEPASVEPDDFEYNGLSSSPYQIIGKEDLDLDILAYLENLHKKPSKNTLSG